jgi:hypothetical protein
MVLEEMLGIATPIACVGRLEFKKFLTLNKEV